jgi:hypothetical protein
MPKTAATATDAEKRIQSFEEFWPYYVREHSKKSTRRLHFVGTTLAMMCAGGALLSGRKSLLLLAPVVGYGPAWISHFFIEGNKPATFDYPLWSLKADLVMWTKMAAGTMDHEVDMAFARSIVDEAITESAPKNGNADANGAASSPVSAPTNGVAH